jgi:CDP-diglyceride synthetase
MQAQKSKIASVEDQMQRGKSIGGALFFFIFVFVMSIPILDILAGFAIIIYMPMLIFARSAQRAVDFGWLLLGAALCMFGFFLPGIFEGPTSSGFFHGWLLEVFLNAAVGWFILARRLGHLFVQPTDEA